MHSYLIYSICRPLKVLAISKKKKEKAYLPKLKLKVGARQTNIFLRMTLASVVTMIE